MENKRKIVLPIKIIIIGVIIGLFVAGIGGIRHLNANKTNEERKQVALKNSEEAVNNANERLEQIEKEHSQLKKQYDAKSNECNSIVTGSDGWFEKKSKCQSEMMELQRKLSNLESESSSIKNKDYTVYYQEVDSMSYLIFYIIGASIAFLSLLAAFIIYLVKGKKTY